MMDDEHLNTPDDEKELGKHIRAAFYEKLLLCCVCGKIYFSKQPIALLALSRKSFYICADCSNALMCSRCSSALSTEAALVVENRSHNSVEILCHSCRDSVIVGSGIIFRGIGKKLNAMKKRCFTAVSQCVSRIFRSDIWPRRRRSKY